jgi:hypothetical protein
MGKIFVITEGENDEYGMVSAWSSKEEADRECSLLNAGMLYDACRVEELSLDVSSINEGYGMIRGFKAVYDFNAHGMDMVIENVVFTDALLSPSVGRSLLFGKSYIAVCGPTKEECVRLLFDGLTEKQALNEDESR